MTAVRPMLERIYAAFNARDIDAVLAAMHPDVDWPNGMEGGRLLGHAAVRAYWIRQWALIDPRVEPTGFSVEADGRVAVQVHQVVRNPAGRLLREDSVQHVYTVRDGLIMAMEIRQGEIRQGRFDMDAIDLDEAAGSLTEMAIDPGRTREEGAGSMSFLGPFNQCTLGLVRFSGQTPWERHPGGDELLHVLTGEVRVTLLGEGGRTEATLRAGSIFVVPRGVWHRQVASAGVTLLFATPTEETEHSWAEDPRSS
jgi:mannose-6-phosphate isomerase-like protein (cupin superfamily)/ketosteroid isomerase-like protein